MNPQVKERYENEVPRKETVKKHAWLARLAGKKQVQALWNTCGFSPASTHGLVWISGESSLLRETDEVWGG